jgi:D-alanine-D-alanine ligase
VQVHRGQSLNQLMEQIEMELGGLPVFVKPNAEGSTVGCALVTTGEQLLPAVEAALRYDPVALIERYVRGVEITVGVLGNAGGRVEPLPTIEIVPRAAFYDYESKYADGGSEHLIPARLPDTLQQEAQEIAVRCHNLLGCRGMSRTDLIVSEGRPYVLEINTIPGMTPTSLLPQAAAHAGIDFQALLDRLIAAALES